MMAHPAHNLPSLAHTKVPPCGAQSPVLTAREALTHTTGKAGVSGVTYGKRDDSGVIHSGRNGLASSGEGI